MASTVYPFLLSFSPPAPQHLAGKNPQGVPISSPSLEDEAVAAARRVCTEKSHTIVTTRPKSLSSSLSPPLSPSFAYRTADARGRGRGRGGIDASFASFETKSISTSPRSKGFVSIRWTNSHEKPLIVDPPLQNFSSFFFFQRTFSDPDSSHRVIIGIETYSRREEKREEYARARGLIREL